MLARAHQKKEEVRIQIALLRRDFKHLLDQNDFFLNTWDSPRRFVSFIDNLYKHINFYSWLIQYKAYEEPQTKGYAIYLTIGKFDVGSFLKR